MTADNVEHATTPKHFVMGTAIPALRTALKFAMSCSRGALLEGALKRSRMRRLHVCFANTRSGGAGSPSGLTMGLCRSRLDADRMKAEKSRRIKTHGVRPVPEVRSSRPKSPPNSSQACADCVNLIVERREAMRFRTTSPRKRCRKRNNTTCALRRSMPLIGFERHS